MSRKASKLRELFDSALERSAAERDAWIDEVCSGDPELRADLAALVHAHESDAAWLDSPTPARPGVGRQAGPYTLVGELGHGGMGTVYLAERTIGRVRQKVAVKIVRSGLASNTEVIRRFQQEREILASLEHPNIARLLDIGSTEDGVPYLVMDYVPGQTIDAWCAERGGDIPEMLRVFCVACDALQYAHDHGVIHRDLKPGNILITPDGMLKLLDFGIARLLRLDGETQTLATFTGPAPMTIEYASPEQIRGTPAGPQSDVYSLGVVLFELLTRRRPFESQSRLIHEVAAAICGEPPVTPSLAAPSGDIRRQVAGDLDAIILKALRKEPDWRYARPGDLSADIRRHLAGDRVLARADTARYRLERFARRLLYPSEGVFQRPQGSLMWTAGVLGVLFLAERHQILTGAKATPSTTLGALMLAGWILWAIREGIRMTRAGRFSAIDRQAWTVFTVITVVAGTLTVVSSLRTTIVPESMAIFWIAALAAGLLIVGLQASRLMTAGGVALLLSAVLAAAFPQSVYLCLAGGMFAGMVIPGLIFTFRPMDHRPVNQEAPRQ